MRARVAVALIVIGLLALLAIILVRRSKTPDPARRPIPAKRTPVTPAKQGSPEIKPVEIKSTIAAEKPDPAAARRALGTCLKSMSLDRIQQWAQELEAMHGGAC